MPAFRTAVAALDDGSFSNPNVTLTIPAAVQVDDLMIFTVAAYYTHTFTTPAGWTLLRSDAAPGGTFPVKHWIFYRFADAGDTGGATTVTTVQTPISRWNAALLAWEGTDPVAPFNAQDAAGSSSDGTTLTAPSVTTTIAGCRIVELFALFNTVANTVTITNPAFTLFNLHRTFNDFLVSAGSEQPVPADPPLAAGATGTQTATVSHTGSWVATTLALAPLVVLGGWGVGQIRMGAN